MIGTILARAAALLARFAFWRQRDREPGESTPEEEAALLAALNPPYRLYMSDESGKFQDVAVDERGGEISVSDRQ